MSENGDIELTPESVHIIRARKLKRLFLDHVWGPFGSVIIHVLIIFALVKFLQFTTRSPDSEIQVEMVEMEVVEIEELEELVKEIQEIELPPVDVQVDIQHDMPTPDDVAPMDTVADVDFSALDVMNDLSSPLVLKGLFAGRSASGRAAMLRQFGGNPRTEASVTKALDWLARVQNASGAWPQNAPAASNHPGVTGLALLTFLAHGETPSSEKYGTTVEKAIRYLLSAQTDDGNFKGVDGHNYSHAIATYALAEAYALTRIPALKGAVDKAAIIIVKGQQAGGGWDYKYAKTERRDTSYVAWQAQALKAAYMAGSEIPGLQDAMRKSIEDLKKHYRPRDGGGGLFTYTSSGGTPSTTGGGALSLQLLGQGRSSEVQGALNYFKSIGVDWRNPPHNNGPYSWYYITQSCFHAGESHWTAWNRKFSDPIINAQEPDGRWEPPKEGKQNPGNVLNTTLAALTLQVYYRHLPTFKEDAVRPEQLQESSSGEDDVQIDIII